MENGEKVVQYLSRILRGWEFSFIGVLRKSIGNVTSWKLVLLSYYISWDFSSRLNTSLFSLDLGKEITFLNIYGPYIDKI